jgi:hypothetical protein
MKKILCLIFLFIFSLNINLSYWNDNITNFTESEYKEFYNLHLDAINNWLKEDKKNKFIYTSKDEYSYIFWFFSNAGDKKQKKYNKTTIDIIKQMKDISTDTKKWSNPLYATYSKNVLKVWDAIELKWLWILSDARNREVIVLISDEKWNFNNSIQYSYLSLIETNFKYNSDGTKFDNSNLKILYTCYSKSIDKSTAKSCLNNYMVFSKKYNIINTDENKLFFLDYEINKSIVKKCSKWTKELSKKEFNSLKLFIKNTQAFWDNNDIYSILWINLNSDTIYTKSKSKNLFCFKK